MRSVQRHPVRILGAGLLLVLGAVLAALLLSSTGMLRIGSANGSQGGTIHHFSIGYPTQYTNLHELKAASPLIVVGTVQDFRPYYDTRDISGIGMTLWTVHVEQVVKNLQPGPDALPVVPAAITTLAVLQYGGPNDVNDSDPALHVGERLVLFLWPTELGGGISYVNPPTPDSGNDTACLFVNGGIGQWIVGPGDTVVHHRPWPTSGQQEQSKAIPLAAFLAQVQAA
jgi:hypothetical protein